MTFALFSARLGRLALSLTLAAQLAGPAHAEEALQTTRLSLRQLAAGQSLTLRGDGGSRTVNFGARQDALIEKARLHLTYSYSPALIPEQSHVQILLNEQIIGLAPTPRAQAGQLVMQTVELDPRLFADYNQLQFRLVGHYTQQCEDPLHSSLWAQISPLSELELAARGLPLALDLARLPEPFFDARDFQRLTLPMHLAAQADTDTLYAASVLASWWGAQAGWRGVRFPVAALDAPPERNAILLLTNAQRPAWLGAVPPVNGPAVQLLRHPSRPDVTLLLALGRDSRDLRTVAQALALGHDALSGMRADIRHITPIKPRQPYDAPRWVRHDRPTRLGELADNPAALAVSGQQGSVRLKLRVPPDVFAWGQRGVPLDLRYRYTPTQRISDARLTVKLNEQFIQAMPLTPAGQQHIKLPLALPGDGQQPNISQIALPAFSLSGRNQLEFAFSFVSEKTGQCQGMLTNTDQGGIDPDSTVDFSDYPHYAEMPNLAFFVGSGYPFTRLADAADTVVALPDAPTAADLETLLTLMGRLGESTGYPVFGLRLLPARQLPAQLDADLLVIGAAPAQPLLAKWQAQLPALLAASQRQSGRPIRPDASRSGIDRPAEDSQPSARVTSDADGPLAALIGMQSPLAAGRSVVMVTGSSAEAQRALLDALDDPARANAMHGSVAFVRANDVLSAQLGERYYVGELPLHWRLWWRLSQHPLLLGGLGLLSVLVFAMLVLRSLRAVARRRLALRQKPKD